MVPVSTAHSSDIRPDRTVAMLSYTNSRFNSYLLFVWLRHGWNMAHAYLGVFSLVLILSNLLSDGCQSSPSVPYILAVHRNLKGRPAVCSVFFSSFSVFCVFFSSGVNRMPYSANTTSFSFPTYWIDPIIPVTANTMTVAAATSSVQCIPGPATLVYAGVMPPRIVSLQNT